MATRRKTAEAGRPPRARRSKTQRPNTLRNIGGSLVGIEGTLRLAYAAAVTAALALRAQNSDYDGDVAGCLRIGVCEPLETQLEQLQDVIRRLASKQSK